MCVLVFQGCLENDGLCVVLVVTAKKQLADDSAALLGNQCHEQSSLSAGWRYLFLLATGEARMCCPKARTSTAIISLHQLVKACRLFFFCCFFCAAQLDHQEIYVFTHSRIDDAINFVHENNRILKEMLEHMEGFTK